MDPVATRIYRVDDLTIDVLRRVVRRGAETLDLRPKCFDVLVLLVEHAGQVLSRDELAERAWPRVLVSDESLSRCISDLRQALGDRGQRIVKTVPGRGYVVAAPVQALDAGPVPAAVTGVPPQRPSVAVLPFVNWGRDPEQDFFSDGITEDITAALARLGGFLVIARNTMAAYKGRTVDVRALGLELPVHYVVEGSVRRAGRRLRVSARLLDARSGSHLWAEHYDQDVGDLFAIQDEITASVVGRIGPELLAAEVTRANRKPAQSLDAWECVARALFHSSQQSEEATRTALGWLERALQHEPDHAQALGMTAWILVFRAFQGWGDMGQALQRAQTLIAQALAVDKDELWPYLAQGMLGFATRDNELSVAALERAVALSPNSVNAHGHLGIAHAFGGRAAPARASIDRAMRLSPRDTYLSDFELYNAFAGFQAGQYEQALRDARQARQLRPGHPYPVLLAAACAGHLQQPALGACLVAELRAIVPVASIAWVEATAPYVVQADRDRLSQGLRQSGLA